MVILFSTFLSTLQSSTIALKKPMLDDFYRRMRVLDNSQVNEKMAVMSNAILQLESQGEEKESGVETVLMVGNTSDGISNPE